MKTKSIITALFVLPVLGSCTFEQEVKSFEKKAALINKYENVSLILAKENREQKAEIKRLQFEVEKLKQEVAYKESQLTKFTTTLASGDDGKTSRSIASVKPFEITVGKDFVEYETYKWTPQDMLKIADSEFKLKNFEKAAQYYNAILANYPVFQKIDDELLFKAGISAYETGAHHDWTIAHFSHLMKRYPKSAHYRGAKLWVALTHMKMGEKEKFFETVEEFRKKYRNTNEWKILSSYYETIAEKTNE